MSSLASTIAISSLKRETSIPRPMADRALPASTAAGWAPTAIWCWRRSRSNSIPSANPPTASAAARRLAPRALPHRPKRCATLRRWRLNNRRAAAARRPPAIVAPFGQREKRQAQRRAPRGQPIFGTGAPARLAIVAPRQQTGGGQALEPIGEHGARRAELGGEIVEPPSPNSAERRTIKLQRSPISAKARARLQSRGDRGERRGGGLAGMSSSALGFPSIFGMQAARLILGCRRVTANWQAVALFLEIRPLWRASLLRSAGLALKVSHRGLHPKRR